MEAPLERRKRFVSIRSEARYARLRSEAPDWSGGSNYTTSVHYLASAYLNDSSLSTDVAHFTSPTAMHSAAATMSGSSDPTRKAPSEDRSGSDLESSSGSTSGSLTHPEQSIELEVDELNQHECMAGLIALLTHMVEHNISPQPDQDRPLEMPPWMRYFHQKLSSDSTNFNTKLFIARLIVNTEQVFRPFAKFWFSPLVQLIVGDHKKLEGINYFVVDVVVTMLSWHQVAIPQDSSLERAMATRLVEHLMRNAAHQSRQVFKNNLEVIKTCVEVWKQRITVPTKVIFDRLQPTAGDDKYTMTGVQLLGIVIANKLQPCNTTDDISRERLYTSLAKNLRSHLKIVYAPTAEVIGMSLRYLDDESSTVGETQKTWFNGYVDYVARILQELQNKKLDQFITALYKIQLYYPQISQRFMAKVLYHVPTLYGEFRTQCLDIIRVNVAHIDNVFVELSNKGITGILEHRDEASQHSGLQLVEAMLPHITTDNLLTLLPAIRGFTQCNNAAIRGTMYRVFMWIYDQYRHDMTNEVHQILSATKECLLRGLSDEDLHNRLTVQNFWTDSSRLPDDTFDRMVAMLEAMYSPATESDYLTYASNLLMEMTSKSPDYKRSMFEHPLSECSFRSYTVSSSWKQRHAMMTPLFIESQSQSQALTRDTAAMDDDDSLLATTEEPRHLRATQQVPQFTPTQADNASRAPYNWLTQSSLDTFNASGFTQVLDPATQSSTLLFNRTSGRGSDKPGTSYQSRSSGTGARIRATQGRADGEEKSEILRLKRRFVKDQEQSRIFFIQQQQRKAKMREEVRREQRSRREHQVTMYRQYRIGDLPDIQISYSQVIAPLQALAQRNATVARLLYGAVFKAIFSILDTIQIERDAQETTSKISECLNQMLTDSTHYNSNFIAWVVDIAYSFSKKLKLDAGAVNVACVTSSQQALGILLLEEVLIHSCGEESKPASKRSRVSAPRAAVSQETTTWIELARLYKSINNYDVLQGIFSNHVGTQECTMKAMQCEMRADYNTAASIYSEALSRSDWPPDAVPDEVELDLWDSSRLCCYERLTSWDDLNSIVCDAIDDSQDNKNLDQVWLDTYSQENYLPYLIRSKTKLLIEGRGDQQELLTFVDAAMKHEERRMLLESRHNEELAMMYTYQQDYSQAERYVNSAIQVFLQNWSSLDRLMSINRRSCVQHLQALTEIKEFLKFVQNEDNLGRTRHSRALLDSWLTRLPDYITDSSVVWDDVISNRCCFIDLLDQHSTGEDESSLYDSYKVKLRLAQVRAAREQDAFSVALKLLKTTRKLAFSSSDNSLRVKWVHSYASTHQQRTVKLDLEPTTKMGILLDTVKQLDVLKNHEALSTDVPLSSSHSHVYGLSVELLHDVISSDREQFATLDPANKDRLCALCDGNKKREQILSSLLETAYARFTSAVHSATSTSAATAAATEVKKSCDVSVVIKAHMALLRFCDKHLHTHEEQDTTPGSSTSSSGSGSGETSSLPSGLVTGFASSVIDSLLCAMSLGCKEAWQRFPRLVQIVEYYPDTMQSFIDKSTTLPVWMYVGWVSQLTAVLDKPESPAVQDILINMATLYPQAVVYAFKMSDDGYKFTSDAKGRKAKEVRNSLEALLSKNKLINAFIFSLEQFGQPNHLFKDWYEDIGQLLQPKKTQDRDKDAILKNFQQFYQNFVDIKSESEAELYDSVSSDDGAQIVAGIGKYRQKFAKEFSRKIRELCGPNGSKLSSLSYRDFTKKAQEIGKLMEEKAQRDMKPPNQLKEYSDWLANFKANAYDDYLEIPGQYTGFVKPQLEYHTKISSFDERVSVMSSIRKPKTLIMQGNDEKNYKFLVKGGEDLRQDQRIEQLFDLMNQVFREDPQCRSRGLELRTYQVVPMTPRVGLIEWMTHTTPLKVFLYEALTDDEKAVVKGASVAYDRWIKNPGDSIRDRYFKLYKQYTRADTQTALKQREAMYPWNLLRRAYHQLSSSLEAYFTLRTNMAVTQGVLCICQYLLGIGDRHLSNFMIDLQNGAMVGIDFGHAFGSATQFLPVPELMPFRMTRQIRNLTLPLREKGSLESTMIHTLRALRAHKDLLLTTMDVFIKEPSLDWKQNAQRQKKAMSAKADDSEGDEQWYPKQKVQFAKRKLLGDNPCHISRDELALGSHSRCSEYKNMVATLLGDKSHDIRATLPAAGLTVEQQVACLLNQATDPAILGRVYTGWEPWV